MSFDAGALIWKIQTIGLNAAEKDFEAVEKAMQRAGRSAGQSKGEVQGLGTAAEKAGKSAAQASKDAEKLGSATEKTARQAASAKSQVESLGKSSEAAGKAAARGAEQVSKARKTEQDAAGRVRVAESQLADARKKYAADSTQVIRAEERLAAATRNLEQAQHKQSASADEQAASAQKLSSALLLAGAGIGAMVGLAVAKQTEFGKAMSNVSAATMANIADQKRLSEAALQAGADTAYSASEAAAAEEELAKAGMNVDQVISGGLNGSLALAAAGQLEVARSAEVMATALTQFQLPAEQAGHVADVLAAGAGKAQGSVDDMALALSYVGPLAKSAGWNIEETAGTLSYFASQGILGEKAGTALRGVLAALQSPSIAAQKTMEQYGISIYDANGKMLSAAGVTEQLASKFGGLEDAERNAAMGRIFGTESLLAATLLYQGGAKQITEWTDKVNDSGYAAEQAAMRQDNLAGDVEKLGGAFDTALIQSGSAGNDVLRELVQSATALVDGFTELDPAVQGGVLAFGAALGAAALLSGGVLTLRGKYAELKSAIELTNGSMKASSIAAGITGIALTGVLAVVGMVASAQAEARAKAEAYADTLEEGTNRITDATREMAAENLAAKESFALWSGDNSALSYADKLGVNLGTLKDAASGNTSAMKELKAQLDELTFGSDAAKTKAEELGVSQADLATWVLYVQEAVAGENRSIDDAIKTQELKQKADRESADSSEAAAGGAESAMDAYLKEADAVQQLQSDLDKLIDQINDANGINQDAISSNADYQAALAGISDEVERQKKEWEEANGSLSGFNLSLDENTEAGSANAASLSNVAQSAQEAAEAQYKVDQTSMSGKDAAEKYAATLSAQREAFINSATAAGYNADQVKALADRVFELPPEKAIDILANTTNAQAQMRDLQAWMDQNPMVRRITLETITIGGPTPGGRTISQDGTAQANGGVLDYYANGGTRENHVAQIARAGAWRVWAEDETGGEAYIPLASSKRARSEAIMLQTAIRLGGQYIPSGEMGAQAFANGGIAAEQQAYNAALKREASARSAWQKADRDLDRNHNSKKIKARAQSLKKTYEDARDDRESAEDDLSAARRAVSDTRWDWTVDSRRGDISEARKTTGGGLGLVDRARDLARQVGGSTGRSMDKTSASVEKNLVALEGASAKTAVALDKAKTSLDTAKDRYSTLIDVLADGGSKKAAAAVHQQMTWADKLEKTLTDADTKIAGAQAAYDDWLSALGRTTATGSARQLESWGKQLDKVTASLDAGSKLNLKGIESTLKGLPKAAVKSAEQYTAALSSVNDAIAAAKDRVAVLQGMLGKTPLTHLEALQKRLDDANTRVADWQQRLDALNAILGKSTSTTDKYEVTATRLSTALDTARSKLDSLRSASESMASSVSSSVRSFFNLGSLAEKTTTQKTTTSTRKVGGVTLSTSSTQDVEQDPTAASFLKGIKASADGIRAFNMQITNLAKRGIDPALLDEVANLGVEQGGTLAKVLQGMTSEQLKEVNKQYAAIGSLSAATGQTVANKNYSSDIKAAEGAVKKVEDQIKKLAADYQKQLTAANTSLSGVKGDISKELVEAQKAVSAATATKTTLEKLGSQRATEAKEALANAKDHKNQILARWDKKIPELQADIRAAQSTVTRIKQSEDNIKSKINVETTRIVKAINAGLKAGTKRAGGGAIYGPGTGTSDSIAAWLSNGEHVLTADEVRAAGGHAAVERWRESLRAGARIPAYAGGGPVVRVPISAQTASSRAPQGLPPEVVRALTELVQSRARSKGDLNIEHFHAGSLTPAQVFDELDWRSR